MADENEKDETIVVFYSVFHDRLSKKCQVLPQRFTFTANLI